MNDTEINAQKTKLRSWLFQLLSKVEVCDNVTGEWSETGNNIRLNLLFNVPALKKDNESHG